MYMNNQHSGFAHNISFACVHNAHHVDINKSASDKLVASSVPIYVVYLYFHYHFYVLTNFKKKMQISSSLKVWCNFFHMHNLIPT